ncbi:hypothetical protein [Clostridium butyricum]
MSEICIYVDNNEVEAKSVHESTKTRLTKIIRLIKPISENSTIKIFVDGYECTDKFMNLTEFNNQHGGAGNLIGSYIFYYQSESKNIVVKLDVEVKFMLDEYKYDWCEWKSRIRDLVSIVEQKFGVSYVNKYLLRSIYGYEYAENINCESIAHIFIESYKKILKSYENITKNNIFKNTVSNMCYTEYYESNSIKSDIYNDIFNESNKDKVWSERSHIEYNTYEIQYLHYIFYKFVKSINICIEKLERLSLQEHNTLSNITLTETLNYLSIIKRKFGSIAVNCIAFLPKRALTNKEYRYIYKIFKKVIAKCKLVEDFSRYLEKETLHSVNYMNKQYEIALFQKIAEVLENQFNKKAKCKKTKNGLLYEFILQNTRINLYFPFGGDLSDINLRVDLKLGKKANLDTIISIESTDSVKIFIIDSKYKYYGIYDEDIGQMVRYANSIKCNRNIKLELIACYLVYPFSKNDKIKMCMLDKKYIALCDDLTNDYMLYNEIQNQLSIIFSERMILGDIKNNYFVNKDKNIIDYSRDGSVKSFNVSNRVDLELLKNRLYRVENERYYFAWGKYLITIGNKYSYHVVLNKKVEIKETNLNYFPMVLLEYSYKINKEKTIKFMEKVLWCVSKKDDEFFTYSITGTKYYYKLTIDVHENFNRINYISRELDIYLEAIMDVDEFLNKFKFLDLDECYIFNAELEGFIEIGYIRESTMGINIQSIYIDNKFCFTIYDNMEAIKVILYYLVLIKESDIHKLLETNIVSYDIRIYYKPGLIPGTCLFFEEDEYNNNLFSDLCMLSKLCNIDIKAKVDWNGREH